jgi:uncharacterized protein (DUF1501 family)
VPPAAILGGLLHNEYEAEANAQSAAWMGREFEAWHADHSARGNSRVCETALDLSRESWNVRQRFGQHDLGRMCLQARRLIERDTRIVTINQFASVMDCTTWDMHANGGRLNSTHRDYRATLCPQLDQALSALLDDLSERGLLSETLVVACGEMGRTPRINCYGGRDHHTAVWSALLAGGPIRAGQVVGSSDAEGAEVGSRPVSTMELCSTIYSAFGVDAQAGVTTDPLGQRHSIVNAPPIAELF